MNKIYETEIIIPLNPNLSIKIPVSGVTIIPII